MTEEIPGRRAQMSHPVGQPQGVAVSHNLGPIRMDESGYLAVCSCEKRIEHSRRDGVEALHEKHVRIEELRTQLEEGNA